MTCAIIALAAGKGSRMQSDLPKVLHKIAGAPLVTHALSSTLDLEPSRMIIVTGHGGNLVEAEMAETFPMAQCVRQTEQLGTGHAVDQARDLLGGFSGTVIVIYGDTPFISQQTFENMIAARAAADVVVLGFHAKDPAKYGRLVTDGDDLLKIVEYKDANEAERAIDFCNSGVIAADAALLFDLIAKLDNKNASGEYYLTDIVALAKSAGQRAVAITCDEAETMGVNSRRDLAIAEAEFQNRKRLEALENGITMHAPETVYFAYDTVIGPDTIIEPNVVFGPEVTIENGAHIRAFSHLEGCHVSSGAVVGPYARIRPGTELGEDVKIGNFVETKNAVLHAGAKVNHLSYIGDAEVGKETNIGAGTITCNYDGVMKHRTEIGERAFIGSNTMLVAPVSIGDEAMTASGSVITKSVPEGALAMARGEQTNKSGMARKLMQMLRAKKAKQGK